jgi:hypothetical protein
MPAKAGATMQVSQFRVDEMALHTITLSCGPRKSGKTTLTFDVTKELGQRVDYCFVMCPSPSAIEEFQQIVPRSFIYTQVDTDVISRIMTTQRKLIAKGRRRNILLILDDCLSTEGFGKSEAMTDLFQNGRHQQVTVIVIAQYIKTLPPLLRENVEYLFIFKTANTGVLEEYHKSYFNSALPAKKEFFKVARSIMAENHRAVAWSKYEDDKVFFYLADPSKPLVQVGCRAAWKLHHRYIIAKRPTEDDSDDDVVGIPTCGGGGAPALPTKITVGVRG